MLDPNTSTDHILKDEDHELNNMNGSNRRTTMNGALRSPPAVEDSFQSNGSTIAPSRVNTITMEEGGPSSTQDYNEKEKKEHKSILGQLKVAIFNSYINILLVFVPVGIATHYAGVDP